MQAVYRWWATWLFAAIVVQIGLAGYGAFYVAGKTDNNGVVNSDSFDSGFGAHVVWGYLAVGLSILILVAIGLIGGIGKWRLGRQGILFLLFVLQVVLAGGGYATPYVGFFHPVNALVIFGLSGSIVYTTWKAARAPAPAEPGLA
jgi:hypothetical protein